MSDLGFLYAPMGQVYNGTQQVIQDQQGNQQRDLSNQTTAAQLPGVMGNSQSLAAKGQVDTAMAPSNIQAGQATNAEKVSASQVQQMSDVGAKFGQASAMLRDVPAAARPQAFQDMANKMGLPIDSPAFQKLVQAANDNPDRMPDMFDHVAGQMAATSSAARSQMALEREKEAGQDRRNTSTNAMHVQTAAGNNDATKYAADAAANSRIKVAQSRTDTAMNYMTPDKRRTFLGAIPDDERTPAQQNEFQRLEREYLAKPAISANATAAALMGGTNPQLPLDAAQKTADDMTRRAPPTAPTGPQGLDVSKLTPQQRDFLEKTDPTAFANGTADFERGGQASGNGDPQIQAAVKAAGGTYDPAKYEYKIVNGKVLSKAKH